MIKIINITFLFIISIKGFSQNICGVVDYKYTKNVAYLYEQQFKMTFNNSTSYSKEVKIKALESNEIKKYSDKGLTKNIIAGRKNITPAFYYNTRDDFYFSDIWPDDVLIVKEDPFNWDWQLHKETKKIGNFICQKASIHFRGRDYIAWFTNEIPVPFGPWKFQGLSGLILEVYNTDETFHIIVNQLKILDNLNCIIEFNEKQLENALNISQFI